MRGDVAAATLLPMQGATVLLTGLPATGKTTLANTLADRLRGLECFAAFYDADAIRVERAESAAEIVIARLRRDGTIVDSPGE